METGKGAVTAIGTDHSSLDSSSSASSCRSSDHLPSPRTATIDAESGIDHVDVPPSRSPSPKTSFLNSNLVQATQPSSFTSPDTNAEKGSSEPLGISWTTSFQPSAAKAKYGDDSSQERGRLDGTATASNDDDEPISRTKKISIFKMRGYDDDDEADWWFVSTAIPLLAATIAPLANVLSIAALVTYWRTNLRDPKSPGKILSDFEGIPYEDPRWCYWLNVGSLICGFVGNIFLLFNFTGRIRYIIALPVTIILWYIATAILTGILIAMHLYVPPEKPFETYSQGYWYAVIAAALYCVCSSMLMLNMLGYFLGHYPQRFELNEHQRTLILQTMLFFIWLAGGGVMFSKIESLGTEEPNWSFVDGLYFCDVTILTVGFGDLVLHNDIGRGLLFPYSVGGIIMLGLVISSISKFAAEMGEDNVVRKHVDRVRARTLERTTDDPMEVERHEILRNLNAAHAPPISAPFGGHYLRRIVSGIKNNIQQKNEESQFNPGREHSLRSSRRGASIIPTVHKRTNIQEALKLRNKRIKLLHGERDRFDEMRRIQQATNRFKRWWALSLSVCAFAVLWCFGAVVFWQAEKEAQGMSYFQALYFCYVSLLTIGYGDFAPKSNAGRPFFVVWSLIAVPTMTLLISDMSTTVIESFKRSTFVAGDFTLLLRKNVWTDYFRNHPKLLNWYEQRRESKAHKKRLKEGIPVGPISDSKREGPMSAREEAALKQDEENQLEHLAEDVSKDMKHPPSEAKMARKLAIAIRHIAADVHSEKDRRYTFEEWAQITRLIRFTTEPQQEALQDEQEDVIEWDWLGEHSPMMSSSTEAGFVLDRLCESLVRYMTRIERRAEQHRNDSVALRRESLVIQRDLGRSTSEAK